MMYKSIFTFLFTICSLHANALTTFSFDKLKDSETIGFLGDSITQGTTMVNGSPWKDEDGRKGNIEQSGLYHQYIQLFLSIRYPGKDLWTVNLGHAGGKSDDGIKRLDYDVLPYKLNYTFVHFGMNDFRYFLYLNDNSRPNTAKKEKMQIQYTSHMTSLINSLQENNSSVVLLSPTIYDEFQKASSKTAKGAQAELQNYGKLAQNLAQVKKLSFVDLFSPMLSLTKTQQAKKPNWSFTKDRVHPAETNGGSEFMAYTILKTLGAFGVVYDLQMNTSGSIKKEINAKVSSFKKEGDHISFLLKETSLPFPIQRSNVGFNKYVPFQSELNKQILSVTGLSKGKYVVAIDGVQIGTYSAEYFEKGINLSANSKTPQYQLAKTIRDLVLFRKTILEQRIRVVRNNIRFALKGTKNIDWNSPESILQAVKKFKAAKKISGWQAYLMNTASYTLPRYQETLDELEGIRKTLSELPKERVHKYSIRKVD